MVLWFVAEASNPAWASTGMGLAARPHPCPTAREDVGPADDMGVGGRGLRAPPPPILCVHRMITGTEKSQNCRNRSVMKQVYTSTGFKNYFF